MGTKHDAKLSIKIFVAELIYLFRNHTFHLSGGYHRSTWYFSEIKVAPMSGENFYDAMETM
jgi:hypothetical protein